MDRVRLPTIDSANPLGASVYGTLAPLRLPTVRGSNGSTPAQFPVGTGQRNAADRFLAKYAQDLSGGEYDQFGQAFGMTGDVGGEFTNVGAIAGGALASAAPYINESAKRNGIPANLLAAIIARESTGNWNRDGNRYVYLPDRGHYILPYTGMTDPALKRVGMDGQSLIGNMPGQIEAAARLVRQIADNEAKGYGWQGVANVYYSGDPTGNTTPSDSYQYGTTKSYGNDILRFWEMLEPGGSSGTPTKGPARSAGADLFATFGGTQAPLTQEFGLTDFARSAFGSSMYGYADSLGVQGHAGLDYGLNPGTPLYAPVAGTVIVAGGSGFYSDERYNKYTPGIGELRLKLDNGDEVILGHMEAINVRVGQRIAAGTPVGRSGTYNGGHTHIEVRQYAPGATSSGYKAVDPRAYFGSFSGLTGGGSTAQQAGSAFAGLQNFGTGTKSSKGFTSLGANLASLFNW